MDYSKNFLTEEQIDESELLVIPLSHIKEMLNEYVYFKGIIELDNNPIYVDGYFILEEFYCHSYNFSYEEIERELHLSDGDWPDTTILKAIKGTPFSNNDNLLDKSLKLRKETELKNIFYSYQQLIEVSNTLKLPTPKPLSELKKKKFNYDVALENKKSIFTVAEALLITSNISFSESVTPAYLPSEYQYNLKSICDCIKAQHESGFHLITRELWIKTRDEFGEEYSRWYENGTCLKASVEIDLSLTLISKAELIRWCEFMEIETGLGINSKEPPISVEALQVKINQLNNELERDRREYQREKERLEKALNSLNEELLQEKTNKQESFESEDESNGLVFPISTKKLRAALKAQNKFWKDYNQGTFPLQKQVSAEIAEELGKKSNTTNRDAEELAKAIQPDEVKRR